MEGKNLEEYLNDILNRELGLVAAIVSDRDGIALGKAVVDGQDLLGSPLFLSSFPIAAEQAGKLHLGSNTGALCFYGNHQVVHFNHAPLYVTLIAESTANSGGLMNLGPEIQKALIPIANAYARGYDL